CISAPRFIESMAPTSPGRSAPTSPRVVSVCATRTSSISMAASMSAPGSSCSEQQLVKRETAALSGRPFAFGNGNLDSGVVAVVVAAEIVGIHIHVVVIVAVVRCGVEQSGALAVIGTTGSVADIVDAEVARRRAVRLIAAPWL